MNASKREHLPPHRSTNTEMKVLKRSFSRESDESQLYEFNATYTQKI